MFPDCLPSRRQNVCSVPNGYFLNFYRIEIFRRLLLILNVVISYYRSTLARARCLVYPTLFQRSYRSTHRYIYSSLEKIKLKLSEESSLSRPRGSLSRACINNHRYIYVSHLSHRVRCSVIETSCTPVSTHSVANFCYFSRCLDDCSSYTLIRKYLYYRLLR